MMKKVRWGVLGTAGIARKCTIPGMQQAENCEMVAIAGRSLAKAEQFKTQFGFRKAYGSYEALLADPEIEAVYIPLPNDLHYEWSIRAMKAGKHVLCEKPLAPTAAQAEEMIRTAHECGVYLMEAFAYLHSPLMAAMKQELDSGVIGKPVYLDAAFLTGTHDLNNIRMRKETYGGSLYDLGCYDTSFVLWMLGREPVKVNAIAAYSPENIDVLTDGQLIFADGVTAALHCGMNLSSGRLDRMEIHGTKGSIIGCAEFNQCGELSYMVKTADKVETKTVTVPHNYRLEVEQMGRCVRGLETPWVSSAFTMANARTMDQLLKSMQY